MRKTNAPHADLLAQVRRSLGITTSSDPEPAATANDIQQSRTETSARDDDHDAQVPMVSDEALRVADQILGISRATDEQILAQDPVRRSVTVEVNGSHYQVAPDGIVLGRKPPPNGITVDNARISRQHAQLLLIEDQLAVIDLQATNGTVIVRADRRLQVRSEPVTLESGDRLATTTGYPIAEIKIYPQG